MAKILSDILFLATAVAAPFVVLDLIIKVVSKNKKRPSEISALVIIFLLGGIIQIISIINHLNKPDFLVIIPVILGFIWSYGIWNMKKWGAAGYAITIVTVQIIFTLQNRLTIFSIFLLFPIVVLYYFSPKMK